MSQLILPNQPKNDEEVLVNILTYLQSKKEHYNQRHRIENIERIMAAYTMLELQRIKKDSSIIQVPGR